MIARVWSTVLVCVCASCTDVDALSIGALPPPPSGSLPVADAAAASNDLDAAEVSFDGSEPSDDAIDATDDLVRDAGLPSEAAAPSGPNPFEDKPCCRDLASRFDASVARCDEVLCRSLPPPPPNKPNFP